MKDILKWHWHVFYREVHSSSEYDNYSDSSFGNPDLALRCQQFHTPLLLHDQYKCQYN